MSNQDQKLPDNLPQEEMVPERPFKKGPFSEKVAEKIPPIPKMTRFGEPEDLVPKKPGKSGLPDVSLGEKSEGTPLKGEYEGPSIEELERKNLIKKVIIAVVLVSFLVLGGVFAYNKWIKKPEVKNEETKITKEERQVTEGDTDEDGMPDEWEKKYGLNLEDARDALFDPDFDKLTNLDEYKYGTDPNNPDTDNDGYQDGEEVKAGYNPKGAGKLETNAGKAAKSFPTMKGTWGGTLSGAVYKSSEFNLTLQSNGNMAGRLVTEILTLKDLTMENELSGTYDYKKEARDFTADIISNAGYKKGQRVLARGNHKLVLEGKVRNNESEIVGTWILNPEEELFWLKQDRGSFSLKKTAEF